MGIEIIVAIGRRGEIGCENRLIWPIKADLKHFKEVTMGHAVIMGRKTWESLPKRPLPGRENVVITRNPEYEAEGAIVAGSITEALQKIKGEGSAFVIGGGQLYAEAVKIADRLHLTRIEAEEPEADTYFPAISDWEWRLVRKSEEYEAEIEGEKVNYRFEEWERR